MLLCLVPSQAACFLVFWDSLCKATCCYFFSIFCWFAFRSSLSCSWALAFLSPSGPCVWIPPPAAPSVSQALPVCPELSPVAPLTHPPVFLVSGCSETKETGCGTLTCLEALEHHLLTACSAGPALLHLCIGITLLLAVWGKPQVLFRQSSVIVFPQQYNSVAKEIPQKAHLICSYPLELESLLRILLF